MAKPKHILVVRLSAMGDVAMTVPVLRVLLDTYPDLRVTVVSRGFFKPFFQSLPEIDFLDADIYGKHKGIPGLIKLAREAKQLRIDAVADLHQVLRSRVMNLYFGLKSIPVAKIDKGRKEKKALVNANGASIKPLKTTHQRYADVFAELGYPIDLSTHRYPIKPIMRSEVKKLLEPDKKYIGIAPFAAFKSKQYPLDQLEEVIETLSKSDKYQLILFGGGEKEVQALDSLVNKYKNTISVAGKYNFEIELNLIAQLNLMLSMDSGNGHLAALFDIPVVTLWGNTHPYAGFVPFGQPHTNQLVADRTQYPLIPTSVYGNKMPEGYENVMETIPAKSVIEKIISLVNSTEI